MPVDVTVSAFRVPAQLQSLAFVRGGLACILHRDPWAALEMDRLLLATGEAVCNAIEHGSTAEGHVDVRVVLDDWGLTVVVVDEGVPGHVPHVNLHAGPPPTASPRGRGMMIMRELSDGISVAPAGGGVRLTMVFARDESAAEDAVPRLRAA